MANILFKRGTQAQFNDLTSYVDGALYFVDDAGQLYLGTGTNSKVRIQGTVVQYDTFKDFSEGITPPYATDVIYYIADSNALVRYDDNSKKWIQLNVTAEDFTALKNRVTTAEGKVETLITDVNVLKDLIGDGIGTDNIVDLISGLDGRVGALETWKTGTVDSAIESYGNRIGAAEQTISAHSTSINTAQTKANEAYTLAEQAKEVADAAVTSSQLTTALNPYAKTEDVNSAFNTLKGGSDKTIAQVVESVGAVQNTANTALTNAATAQEAAEAADAKAVAANNNAETRVLKSDFETYQGQVTEAIADAKKAGTDADKAAQAAQGTANTAVTNAATAQEKANEAYNLAAEKTTMAEVEGKGYATTTEAQGYASDVRGNTDKTVADVMEAAAAASTAAGNAATAANNANNNANSRVLQTEFDAYKSAVTTEINNAIKSNDAMTFMGVVNSAADLPTISSERKPQRGDTYKVGSDVEINDISCRIGDLFINNANDDAEPVWVHIPSGDEQRKDQLLKTDLINNEIELWDEVNSKAISAIKFNSKNIVVSGENSLEIKVDFVWDTF